MDRECEIVRDIMPLYVDDVCSKSSRELVEKHVVGCAECAGMLKKMNNNLPEAELIEEKKTVIRNQTRLFKRKSAVTGAVFAGILLIPVIICLIVNIAAGFTLDWFFIVLASLSLVASVLVVPLMMPANKLLWTIVSFTASLELLLAVCCIFSRGDWFFVAGSAVLFGLAVCLLPAVVNCAPVKKVLKNHRMLTVLATDLLLFYLMMIAIGARSGGYGYFRIVFGTTFPVFATVFGIFAFCRYVKLPGLIKGGIATIFSGLMLFYSDCIVGLIIGSKMAAPVITTVDGALKWMTLIICAVIGAILLVTGCICRLVKGKTK